MTVTVVIPHIPIRKIELIRALTSVAMQVRQPDDVVIAIDNDHRGSAATRNRVLPFYATTEWVAFLDDDDELLPNHLAVLTRAAAEHPDADVIYPGCRVLDPYGRELPLREEWGRFGREFDPDLLRQRSYIPVTSLVRADVARRVLFGTPDGSDYDDWGFYLGALDLGARFIHVPEVTWIWHHHGRNTSGRPDRW